ncbi:tyrosine-type recombinase/integrase [Facklamia sp. P9177]|uniref:tyrosine-type recombinase/integrase n=1 Tax=Facklamia sp. P9177 TaxID=3421945 RepID=UPI003D16DA0E
MWIEDLPNGKYKFCERYEDPLTGKTKKVSITNLKKTKAIREQMLIKLQEKINKNLNELDVRSIPFSELIDKWLVIDDQKSIGQTKITHKVHTDKFKEVLGDLKTDKITASVFNNYLLSLTEKNLAYVTVAGYKNTLSLILQFGKKLGYFQTNLHEELQIEKLNVTKTNPDKYLEKEEIDIIINYLETTKRSEMARIIKLQLLTGTRINELLSLDFEEQIDFKNKTVNINRNYNHALKEFGPPKHGSSRIININQEAINLFKEQIRCTKMKMIKYKQIDSSNSLLFITRNGRILDPGSLNRIIKKIPGLEKEVTTHYFRHTFIVRMIENKIPFHLIAEHVGHKNTRMIEDIYYHFSDSMKSELKSAIDELSFNF